MLTSAFSTARVRANLYDGCLDRGVLPANALPDLIDGLTAGAS